MRQNYLLFTLLVAPLGAISQTVVDTFLYTGSSEMFIYDGCMGDLTLDIRAGSGGDANGVQGGNGGRVQGTLTLSDGDTLYINVGDAGLDDQMDAAGGFGGGGDVYSYSTCGTSGTGGGASDIRLNGTTFADRIAIAGGGGGAGGTISQALVGGAGGDLIGGDGDNWDTWPDAGGKGGTQTVGGAQGVACCSCPTYTTDGALGVGGNGSGDCAGGGGGGSGYYGGGGSCFSGAGGGSSYTDAAVTAVTHTQGFQDGDGMIIISYTIMGETTSSQTLVACDSMVSPSGMYIWDSTGVYLDTIPNTAGCDSVMTIDLTIDSLNDGITATSPTELMADMTGASYQWVDCDNSFAPISGATNQTYTATSNGNYAVVVTNGSCSDTSDCIAVTEVSLDQYNPLDAVTLTPNPFKEYFNLSLNGITSEIQFEIRDVTGKLIRSGIITESESKMNFEGESGTYFVTVKTENHRKVLKVIKE